MVSLESNTSTEDIQNRELDAAELDQENTPIVENGADVLDNGNGYIEDKYTDIAEKQDTVCTYDGDNELIEEGTGNSLPIDRGWAWAILLGAVISVTITIGILKSVGILFMEFQEKFNSSSSVTSLLSTVQNGVYSVSALIVMTAGLKRFSCRQFVVTGSILMSISYVITSQAEDIRIVFLSHGVLHGFSTSCIQPCSLIMVGLYFDKRRGFANSVAISGGSIGGLILAPLLTAMFEYYGYSGCFLVVAGIVLHCCISAMLYRPPSFYMKSRRTKGIGLLELGTVGADEVDTRNNSQVDDFDNHEQVTDIKSGEHNGDIYKFQIIKQKKVSASSESLKRTKMKKSNNAAEDTKNTSASAKLIRSSDEHHVTHAELTTFRERSNTEPSKWVVDVIPERQLGPRTQSEYMGGSMFDFPVFTPPGISAFRESFSEAKRPHSCCGSIWKSLSHTFDFHLFRNTVFVVFTSAAGLLCSSGAMTIFFLAPHAAEQGISKNRIATLLQVYSVIDIVIRICTGYISDKGFMRRSTIIGFSAVISGVFAFLIRFFVSFQWLLFYAVMLGFFGGAYFALFASVIVDYMTVAKLQSCLGFTFLSHGMSISVTFAIVGYLRDYSGSYVLPYGYLGTTSFLGAMLMFALPFVARVYARRMTDKDIHADSYLN